MNTTDFEKLIFDIDKVSTENEFSLCIDTAVKLAEDLNPERCEQLFLVIRGQLIVFIIEKGILPPFTLFQLFPIFNKHITSVVSDARIENHLTLLKKHLSGIERSSYEYFLFVALIFILEIFNTEFEKGFNNYLDYIIKSNIFEAYKYTEAYEQFKSILSHCEISPDDMAEYLGQILEVDSFFQNDAEEQSSILLWIMTVIYTEPHYVVSPAFFKLEKPLANIMLRTLESDMLAMAMQVYNVAHHILGNLFQTQEEMALFNEQFTKPISLYYMRLSGSLPKPISEHKNKKKIAIVRDRLVNNSPHMVEYSLVKMLMEESKFTDRYDLYIYSVGYIEKELDDEKIISAYQQLGVAVKVIPNEWYTKGYYYNHLEKAMIIRNDIIQEGIDIMIGTIGNNNIIDFLFATRSAVHQIYWSHGNHQYDIMGIDQRISHIHKATSYPFSFFYSKTLDVFLKGEGKEEKYRKSALEIRSSYGEEILIFGSIGRLIKMDNEDYIFAVSECLKQCPMSIYLACGIGNIDSIREKFAAFGVEDRIFFPGFVDPHEYGYVLDIYLNTFPESGGESINEFLSKGDDKYLVSYASSVKQYIHDAGLVTEYIQYRKRKEIVSDNLFDLNNKIKLCTDVLKHKDDADFVIYLLNKHKQLVYLVEEGKLNDMQTYLIQNIASESVFRVKTDSIFEYADLADIYIFMENRQLRDLFLWKKKKIVLWNELRENIDGSIKNLFSKINQDYISMNSLSQILNIDPKLFEEQDSIYKLFGIMCAQGGLNQRETELFWNSPDNSIDRNKLFFDLMIMHESLRKIFQEYIYLNCREIFKENGLKSNAAEFIRLLEEKN